MIIGHRRWWQSLRRIGIVISVQLAVEEPSTDAKATYRVVFEKADRKSIEHIFTVDSEGGIDGVKLTDEYWREMPPEPFTKWLCESLIRLHQAIRVVRSD